MIATPLLDEKDIAFLLHDVHASSELCALPDFADHTRATFDLVIGSARRLAAEVLLPAYRPMDSAPPVLEDGRIHVHPAMREVYPALVKTGLFTATRPPSAGGQGLPLLVYTAALSQLFAANVSAALFPALTFGVADLLEKLGTVAQREAYGRPLHEGASTATMAFTEAHAGSDITEVRATATPAEGGHYLLRGEKIFISGGDHDFAENIVHIVLARVAGAPPGPMGLSLFVVPRLRREGDSLVPNDVETTGLLHKLGWRGLPSAILSFGGGGDCRGWLLGEANMALLYLMGALGHVRLLFATTAAASAQAGYRTSLEYARERVQGRPIKASDPAAPPVPIIEHADVRRMLLRQKAISEGALSLALALSKYADVAAHGVTAEEKKRAATLFELLAPAAKAFAGERGFESNALAVQVLGGQGASTDHPVEALLRDQKMSSLHAGTTGLLAMELLAQRALADGGAPLRLLGEEIAKAASRARESGVEASQCDAVERAFGEVAQVTMDLAAFGMAGDPEKMLRHATDYQDLFTTLVIGWQWLLQSAAARECQSESRYAPAFLEGKQAAAQHWIATEIPKIPLLAALCRGAEDSYVRLPQDAF